MSLEFLKCFLLRGDGGFKTGKSNISFFLDIELCVQSPSWLEAGLRLEQTRSKGRWTARSLVRGN